MNVKCCVLPYRERSSSYLACLSSFLHTTGQTAENVNHGRSIVHGEAMLVNHQLVSIDLKDISQIQFYLLSCLPLELYVVWRWQTENGHRTKIIYRTKVNYAEHSFHRAVNAIFAEVGRFASEEVILKFILKKCLPILTYGFEMCVLPKKVLQFLDFTFNRVLMKLFKSSNIVVIEQCRYFLHIELPSVQLQRRFGKFLANAADDDKVY